MKSQSRIAQRQSKIIPVENAITTKPEKSDELKRIEKRLKELRKILNKEHKLFGDEYFRNKYNATQAYLAIYPDVKYESAKAAASKLLTNYNLLEYIDLLYEEKLANTVCDREWLLGIMREIIMLVPTDVTERGETDVVVGIDAELNQLVQKVPTMYVKDLNLIPKGMRRWIKTFKATKDGGFTVTFIDKIPIIHDFGVELGMFKQDTNLNISADKLNISINKPGEVKIANIQQNKK